MNTQSFLIGADLSLAKRIAESGGVYRYGGEERDLLKLLRSAGLSHARLRIFNDPTGHGAQVNDLDYTLDLARALRAEGYELYLAPHFSDGWSDPSKQITPRAWRKLDFAQLLETVQTYSRELMETFKAHDLVPKIVQVGNEITPGMLWEHGRVAGSHGTNSLHWDTGELRRVGKERWQRFSALLKASISGIGEALSGEMPEIMLHIDRGADWDTCCWFFDNIAEQEVPYDLVGLSYYPFWHGMPEQLGENLHRIVERFDKDVCLAELAYPYRHHQFYRDALLENPGVWREITSRYPLSPEGQVRFVEDVTRIVMEVPGGRGRGVFYWAPEWIPIEGHEDEADAEPCWGRALFDYDGNALPALDTIHKIASRQAAIAHAETR